MTGATEAIVTVDEDEMELFIDNRELFRVENLAHILNLVSYTARKQDFLGPDCQIDIVELRTGSIFIRFRFSAEWVSASAAVGALALAIAGFFQPGAHANSAIADLVSDRDIRSVVITTDTQVIRIDKTQLDAAVDKFQRRDAAQEEWRRKNMPPPDDPDLGTVEGISRYTDRPRPMFLTGTLRKGSPPTFETDEGMVLPVYLEGSTRTDLVYNSSLKVLAFVRKQGEAAYLTIARVISATTDPASD